MRMRYIFALFLALTMPPSSALATVIYSYTGPNFDRDRLQLSGSTPPIPYSGVNFISGTIEMPIPLPPNAETGVDEVHSFRFSDGLNVITHLDATDRHFRLRTDSAGEVIEWVVFAIRDEWVGEGIPFHFPP